MFTLSPPGIQAHSPTKPAAPTLLVTGLTPSTESLATHLARRYEHIGVESYQDVIASQQAALKSSLETQQLDHSAQKAALDEVQETIDKYDEDHPHTGPLHVYLLDGQGKALMDQETEDSPLKALVNAAMRDPRRTVACLMPEDATYKEADDISPSTLLRQLADTILSTEGVTILVGKEACESFLQDPSALVFKLATEGYEETLTPTQEDWKDVLVRIGGALTLTALAAAMLVLPFVIVEFFSHMARRRKEAAKNDAQAKKLIDQLRKAIHNPKLLENVTLRTGTVSGTGIAPFLAVNGKMPASPGQALQHSATVVKEWTARYAQELKTYVTQVQALRKEYDAKVAATKGPGEERNKLYAEWRKKLEALKTPLQTQAYPDDIVGDFKARHDGVGDWTANSASTHNAETIPALTKEQLVEAIKGVEALITVIEHVMEVYYVAEEEVYKLGDMEGLYDAPHDVEDENWDRDAVAVHHYRRRRDLTVHLEDLAEHLSKSVGAMGQWIKRSVESTQGSNESLTVSQEGLGVKEWASLGFLGAIFAVGWIWPAYDKWKAKRKEGDPDTMGRLTVEKINVVIQKLKRYNLDNELNRLKLRTGNVSGKGIVGPLAKGKGIPAQPFKAALAHAVEVNSITLAIHRDEVELANRSNPILDAMRAEWKSTGNAKEAIAHAEAKLKSVPLPAQKIQLSKGGHELLGNPEFEEETKRYHALSHEVHFEGVASEGEVPALDRAGMKEAVTTLIVLLETLKEVLSRPSTKLYDGETEISHWDDGALWDDLIDSDPIMNVSWHHNTGDLWGDLDWELTDSLRNVSLAIYRWIDRSIKK
jgi:hypothetical protein